MARPKKYSGENFLEELKDLRFKYRRIATPELSWAIGKFLSDTFLDWNDVMEQFQSRFDVEFEEREPIKVKIKKTKKKK